MSDRDRRDGYIKRRTLVVDSFPTATLTVTELRGLPAVLPTSGTLALTLVGNFTVHGVTKPTTWEVTAAVNGGEFTGKASTHIKFGDFNMTQPRVPIVLSVVDDIVLEYSFHLVKQAPKCTDAAAVTCSPRSVNLAKYQTVPAGFFPPFARRSIHLLIVGALAISEGLWHPGCLFQNVNRGVSSLRCTFTRATSLQEDRC